MNSFLKYAMLSINIFIITAAFVITGCISSVDTESGKLSFRAKDYFKAEQELSKGVMSDKDDIEAWYMLGVSRVEIGKFNEAKIAFDRAKNIYGQEMLSYWGLKFNAGIDQFNEGIKSKNKGAERSSYSKNLNNAIYYFRASYAIIPDSTIAIQLLGESYGHLGIYDSAMIAFKQVIDIPKSEVDAESMAKSMYNIGFTLIQDEEFIGAFEINSQISKIKGLPKTNKYYEISLYNTGLSKYLMGASVFTSKTMLDSLNNALKTETDANKKEKISKKIENINTIVNNGDMKKYFKESLDYLEPLSVLTKDKKRLNDTYDILITVYDVLGETSKRDDITNKKTELNK
jgi:tetratricopeptide (TPR) repeat protein